MPRVPQPTRATLTRSLAPRTFWAEAALSDAAAAVPMTRLMNCRRCMLTLGGEGIGRKGLMRPIRPHSSRENPLHHLPMHVSEAEVAAAVAERQFLVVDAHQVQDGGVQVVDVDPVLDGVHPQLVGRSVDRAALDAAAGQPHGEAAAVVVAALL